MVKMNKSEIKTIRLKLKLSQLKMAEMLNVTRDTVLKWEMGRSIPNGTSMSKLMELKISGVQPNE